MSYAGGPHRVTQITVRGLVDRLGGYMVSPPVSLWFFKNSELGLSTSSHANAVYQNTGFQRYLDTSRRMATFFRDAMPDNGIVPW